MLRKVLLITEGPRLCGENWIFLLDNTAIHNTRRLKEFFFMANNIQLLNHSPWSQDLNPLKYVWRWIAKNVYKYGLQFETGLSLCCSLCILGEHPKHSHTEVNNEYAKVNF